jgi:hypothetical protein
MIASLLMTLSAGIVGALGAGHLLLTFRGPKLLPRDTTLREAMERTSPVITRQTTMWRCWIGFNASHSLGAMLFGLVYGFLAVEHAELLFGSWFLLAVGMAMVGAFVVLAWRYWFVTPLVGASLSLAFYLTSLIVARSG